MSALLNIHGTIAKVGLSKSRIYGLVRLGQFPQPRRIQGRSMWLESQVDTWIAEQWESAQVAGTVAGSPWRPHKKAA